MYVVAYVEHIKALEGVGEGSPMGARTGKTGPEALALFKDEAEARQFCKDIQKHWCSGSQKEPGVRTWWYEIWSYPVLRNSKDDSDSNFVAAYNKFGRDMKMSWTPDYRLVLQTEPKAKKVVKRRKK